MSWFQDVWAAIAGPTPITRGWASGSETKRAATTLAFLAAVAKRAAAADVAIRSLPDDEAAELRGRVRGFPIRVVVNDVGLVQNIEVTYSSRLPPLALTHDPESPAAPDRVVVAPSVFVDGPDATERVEAYRRLPNDVQSRLSHGMVTYRIRYFTSWDDSIDVHPWDDATERKDAEGWVAAMVGLAAEVAEARGATPRVAAPRDDADPEDADPEDLAGALAAAWTAAVPGATLVDEPDEPWIEVRWPDAGTVVRLRIDLGEAQVSLVVPADGVAVHAEFEPTEREEQPAIFLALPDRLFDELWVTMLDLDLDAIVLHEQSLTTILGGLNHAPGRVDAELALARVLARVAAALPRGG